MAHKRIMGTFHDYIDEQLEPNNSKHSRNTRGANLNILHRRYIREKDNNLETLESPSPLSYALLSL